MKSTEDVFKQIMQLRGYYWHYGFGRWTKRGKITMARFKSPNKSVLENIAEVKASDAAYHHHDTIQFPDQEAERLGTDLEWRCLNALVNRIAEDEHEAQGTRIDILELANRFVARVMEPGAKPDPEVKAAAVMASIYRYVEQMVLLQWMEEQHTYLLSRVRLAQKAYTGSLVTLATVARCKWEVLEKVGEQYGKFGFGRTG